jgi:SAM-dependent methyltransferase
MTVRDLNMTETKVPSHPAKYSSAIIEVLREILDIEQKGQPFGLLTVLDPMIGTGKLYDLATPLICIDGVELEQEWAEQHPHTIQGNATNLVMFPSGYFDCVVSSPPYANRLADKFNPKDTSRRMSYKFQLGRDLTEGSGAGMQWNGAYRSWSKLVLAEMIRVVRPGGIVVINISNHIRNKEEQPVSEFWLATMVLMGLHFEKAIPVVTPRMRFGENHQARVDTEWVFVTRRAA